MMAKKIKSKCMYGSVCACVGVCLYPGIFLFKYNFEVIVEIFEIIEK